MKRASRIVIMSSHVHLNLCIRIKQDQEKMREQRETLPVHALGYVNSTKVNYELALEVERKDVFRDVRTKANLHLMWLVSKWRRALGYLKFCR